MKKELMLRLGVEPWAAERQAEIDPLSHSDEILLNEKLKMSSKIFAFLQQWQAKTAWNMTLPDGQLIIKVVILSFIWIRRRIKLIRGNLIWMQRWRTTVKSSRFDLNFYSKLNPGLFLFILDLFKQYFTEKNCSLQQYSN